MAMSRMLATETALKLGHHPNRPQPLVTSAPPLARGHVVAAGRRCHSRAQRQAVGLPRSPRRDEAGAK